MPDTGWISATESSYGSGWDTFDLVANMGVGPEVTDFLSTADITVARRTVPATSAWDTVLTAGGFSFGLVEGDEVVGVEIRILQGPVGLPISDDLRIEALSVSTPESGTAQQWNAVGGWTEIEEATEYLIAGGAADLLGTTEDFDWTDTTVQIRYANHTGSPIQIGVDHVQIKLHYTAAPSGLLDTGWRGCFM